MAILCRDLNLLFIMVPGTGCSVLGNLLKAEFGGEALPERDIVSGGRVVHPAKHNSVPQLLRDGILTADQLSKLTVAANIRNPFDRLVTYYQRLAGDWVDYSLNIQERGIERGRSEMSPDEYDERREALSNRTQRQKRRQRFTHLIGFNSWLLATVIRKSVVRAEVSRFAFPMLEGVHFALRNEALEESINTLFARMGINRTVELPRKNMTQGKRPYGTYWNRLSRSVFTGMVGDDLRRHGYTFEGFDRESPLLELTAGGNPNASSHLTQPAPGAT